MRSKSSNFVEEVWRNITAEAKAVVKNEPLLEIFLNKAVLSHKSFKAALECRLLNALINDYLTKDILSYHFARNQKAHRIESATLDLLAINNRDSACNSNLEAFLFYKGFLALQAHRLAHNLWCDGYQILALLIQSTTSRFYGVDIHPAAKIGSSVMLDHATGLVIGETAVVEDYVSIMQGVTLGGTGKEEGERHPKIRRGVLIGAGAKILGNIEIGAGSMIGACSVVLKAVSPHSLVAGVPGQVIGNTLTDKPALVMNHYFEI
ncbi:MAG: serine O-acetyltransferase [Cellvibrionales bacterium TMED49]|nr:serine O-acetyltransferase [Porticoccaceae bacterium]OUU39327.1 MAG: serine O-acetyltransferase [Cellvibrionales bacterium TMED49]